MLRRAAFVGRPREVLACDFFLPRLAREKALTEIGLDERIELGIVWLLKIGSEIIDRTNIKLADAF